jgi:hypothetical protein
MVSDLYILVAILSILPQTKSPPPVKGVGQLSIYIRLNLCPKYGQRSYRMSQKHPLVANGMKLQTLKPHHALLKLLRFQ